MCRYQAAKSSNYTWGLYDTIEKQFIDFHNYFSLNEALKDQIKYNKEYNLEVKRRNGGNKNA
jgi:hypothetical protein